MHVVHSARPVVPRDRLLRLSDVEAATGCKKSTIYKLMKEGNLPRDEWARVGMAIKSEYPDDLGLQLFSDWSAASGSSFDAGAVRSTWRSIKAGGGVGVSTLLFLAKRHGFKLPRNAREQGRAAQPLSAAQRQQQDEERMQRQQAEALRIEAEQDAAAHEAQAVWEAASTTGQSAYLLTFADPLGVPKQWAMPARMLSSDGGEYRAALLNMGLRIATAPTARNRLTEYIQTRKPEAFASCTDRIGWHGRAFVLPHETIGDDAERIVFQSDNQMENTFRIRREAQDWTDRIGRLCAGNSRLVFAVACAFAGPLLRPAGMESGGFHLRGDSSCGKTTALRLAASVYGGQNYMQRWRTTDNALEASAAQHCDSLLILDELAQVEGKVAGECAYMLANEQRKARATRNGAARTRLTWRLLFLSAGELGLADHMAEGGKRTRTGQEVRMADIPADAGKGMGAFEQLHGLADGAAFSSHLAREAQLCHGAVGHAFLQWATGHADTLAKRVRQQSGALAASWTPGKASGQVARVAARFALVGVAGELATEAGLTGWEPGESERATKACFEAWLLARGGAGNGEVTAMLRQVRGFLEAHGEGRFTWWHRATDDHNAKTLQRAGFRRLIDEDGKPLKILKTGYTPGTSKEDKDIYEAMTAIDGEETRVEYFVLPEVFRTEICRGFDYKAVCKVLLQHGCLKPAKGREYDAKHRLPGMGHAWCYQFTPAIMELEI